MPGQDRTGPFGEGPRTGRGLGPCGFGRRRGFGRMRGRWFQQSSLTEKEEKDLLEEELEGLESEKKDIEARLKELK